MTDNLEIHKVKERIKINNMKQTQDDRTIQPSNCSTIQRVKAYAFTLAETLIVIGIIGVVAALTLPNLNHATGDKETVTRLMKIYASVTEATDRAIVIYGPMEEWECEDCWIHRIGEFMKITKSCDSTKGESCSSLASDNNFDEIVYQFADGSTIASDGYYQNCSYIHTYTDTCLWDLQIDINGPNKGKNKKGEDIFHFWFSDSLGVFTKVNNKVDEQISNCIKNKNSFACTWWVLDYGNLDYLKADNTGKCNDNPLIILDGVNNISCH